VKLFSRVFSVPDSTLPRTTEIPLPGLAVEVLSDPGGVKLPCTGDTQACGVAYFGMYDVRPHLNDLEPGVAADEH
jgi:hypothetical protein